MANQKIPVVLILVLVASSSGLLHKRQNEKPSADDAFNSYILNVFKQNYTTWVAENKLDPTPPVLEPLTLKSSPTAYVVLDCIVTNQQISYESSNESQTFDAERDTGFAFIGISRLSVARNDFIGNFSCTGLMKPVDGEKYYFQGDGIYQMHARLVSTTAVYQNLGVTENYKLDFSVAYTDINISSEVIHTDLCATWNDSRISGAAYYDVWIELTDLYDNFLQFEGTSELHPGKHLLPVFLRNVTEDLDLTTILDDADLPDPFKPNPITTTTNDPTTTPIAKTTSDSQTEPTSTDVEPNPTTTNAPPTSESGTDPTSTDGNNMAASTSTPVALILMSIISAVLRS